MEKYKIVYLVTNCKKTGPMNQTLNIIKNLDRNLFSPILITLFPEMNENSVIDNYKEICSKVYCLNMNKYMSLIIGKKKLFNLLQEIQPALVQAVGMPPYIMSLRYKAAKHLVTLRNYCYEDYPAKYGKFIGPILASKDMRLINKQINKGETFITCSNSLSTIYNKKHGMKFDFIRNGVDTSRYEKTNDDTRIAMREKLGLPVDKKIIIYTGQMIDRKDQQSAIDGFLASKYCDNMVFLLIGGGNNLAQLKQRYAKAHNVIFTGSILNVNDYLQASDLYISTSKSEGMPNGVLEAMAVGLPILLSDIPQHQEIFSINESIGKLYSLGDMKDLIGRIDDMMECDLEKISELSYKTVVNNLTAESMSKKYQNLYISLVEAKHSEKV